MVIVISLRSKPDLELLTGIFWRGGGGGRKGRNSIETGQLDRRS